MLKDKWIVFKNSSLLSKQLTDDILTIAHHSIKLNGSFKIVLTGGRSLIKTYDILRRSDSDWSKWHVYISDERLLPAMHKDRNDQLINKIWLNNNSIPRENIHFIRSELSPIKAQREYEKVLKGVEKFDVVLLSIGEDGHIASLFPGHDYTEDKDVVLEYNSPKSPSKRISMSFNRLNNTRYAFKIIIGKTKKQSVNLWLKGKVLPISRIKGESDQTYACVNAIPRDYL
jgi:6-phosphogluconolactonase